MIESDMFDNVYHLKVSVPATGLIQTRLQCLSSEGECCCNRIESDVFGSACHLKVSAGEVGLNQMCLAMLII